MDFVTTHAPYTVLNYKIEMQQYELATDNVFHTNGSFNFSVLCKEQQNKNHVNDFVCNSVHSLMTPLLDTVDFASIKKPLR